MRCGRWQVVAVAIVSVISLMSMMLSIAVLPAGSQSSTPLEDPPGITRSSGNAEQQSLEPVAASTRPRDCGESSDAPSAGTLVLNPSELGRVRLIHSRIRPTCPKKYIFVNTHTYGRHHNQLQEFMNIIIWGERIGRTPVLGWFRADHRWVDPADLYDFSLIRERYCLVTPKEFADALPSGRTAAACFGQGVSGTPLKRLGGGKAVKCAMQPHVPAHYNTRRATNTTAEFLPRIAGATEDVLVLSGQIAFFLRAGLAEFATIFSLLGPSKEIAEEVMSFTKQKLLASQGRVFSIHLRQREKDCLKEVGEAQEDGARWLLSMSDDDWKVIRTQCAITTRHVTALMHRLSLCLDREQPMFLASDHENKELERALVSSGAVMYEGGRFHTKEHGGLKGLAVDFFLLVQGAYFTGNQLSSISQNACFMRLGQGKPCNGFVEPLARYLVRDLATVRVAT